MMEVFDEEKDNENDLPRGGKGEDIDKGIELPTIDAEVSDAN